MAATAGEARAAVQGLLFSEYSLGDLTVSIPACQRRRFLADIVTATVWAVMATSPEKARMPAVTVPCMEARCSCCTMS